MDAVAATPLQAGTLVRVQAPARLHLGFLDPAATLGRRFGSLGLAVEGRECVVELAPAPADRFSADDEAGRAALPRAREHLAALRASTGCHEPLALRIRQVLPAHAGLGSGTQLALAVGRAYCRLLGLSIGAAELAQRTGRGLRSGVGIAAFEQGGLLLDGGPRADGTPAALLARIELPPAWRVLLAIDPGQRGLSGAQERAALAQLRPLPREAAAEICHEVLMRVLPGAAGDEFAPFAAGLGRVQRLLGEHFAPAQQGRCFTSAAVGRLMAWLAAHGTPAVGQSSWGPTGFALLPSEEHARELLQHARAAGAADPSLTLDIVRPRRRGASVTLLPSR